MDGIETAKLVGPTACTIDGIAGPGPRRSAELRYGFAYDRERCQATVGARRLGFGTVARHRANSDVVGAPGARARAIDAP